MLALATRLQAAIDRRPRVTAAVLVALSAVLLLVRITSPDRIYFDETYYVDDALGYLDTGTEPSFAVHPTVGKWLIAAGIAVLGDQPIGWRISGVAAGVLTVLVTHLLARRLLDGARWGPLLAVMAPVLLMTDGLFLVQSRITMLDVHLVLFGVVAMWLLVIDRDRRRDGLVPPGRPSLRWLAGIALGLALGVKWSALLVIGAAGLLTIAWEVADARRGTAGPAWIGQLPRRAAAVVGSLLVVPAVVYGLTWVPWLAAYEHTWAADCEEPIEECDAVAAPADERLDGLLRYHEAILDFHLNLESDHSYRSDPLGWVVLERPVVYYWETCSVDRAAGVQVTDDETGELVDPEPCEVPAGTAGEILAIGNPGLWWGFLLGVPLLVAGVVRRDGRSAVPLVTWASLWLPWLVVSRAAFLFYLAPLVPFAAVGLAVAIGRLDRRERLAGTYVATVIGAGIALPVAVLALDGGWRERLAAMALGAAVGSVVGAVRDLRLDRRDAVDPPPAPPTPWVDADGPADGDPPTRSDRVDTPVAAWDAPPAAPAVASDPAGVATLTAPAPTDAMVLTAHAGADTPFDMAPEAPPSRVPRVAAIVLAVCIGLWLFFSPVWYAVPLDRDVLEWRWWFSSWI